MNGANEPPRPKVDDRFWFAFSETLVNKALESRDQAAAKLQNLVLWLWGIYTASAAVGFALAGKNLSLWDSVVIAAASAMLIIVYWATIWVQMPRLVQFDPRSPDEISDRAYAHNDKAKQLRLNIALALSVVAAALVFTALMVASTAKPETGQTPRFSAALKVTEGRRNVAITAYVGKTEDLALVIRTLPERSPPQLQKHPFIATDQGMLQTSVPVTLSGDSFRVTLEWTDSSKTRIELSRILP